MSRAVRPTSRRPPVPARLGTAAALALCMVMLAAAWGGMFRVRHVEVVGTGLPRDSIVQTAGIEGTNIFFVRSDQVVTRLAALHEIAVQRVQTAFPDTVRIVAVEREAVAAWHHGSGYAEMDANGVVLRWASTTSLPEIEDPNPPAAGQVQAVAYAARTLPTVPGGDVVRYVGTPASGLSIVGHTGWTAALGSGSPRQMVTRVAILETVLVRAKSHRGQLTFVDLRGQPYVRFSQS